MTESDGASRRPFAQRQHRCYYQKRDVTCGRRMGRCMGRQWCIFGAHMVHVTSPCLSVTAMSFDLVNATQVWHSRNLTAPGGIHGNARIRGEEIRVEKVSFSD